jgi:small conductance mechanosensitive channel
MDPTQIITQMLSAAGISASALPEAIDLSLWNITRSAIILIATYFLARFVRGLLTRTLTKIQLDPRVETLLIQGSFYGIISLGVVWVLGGFGLSILVLGVVAGFALQDLIKNFAAGILIMATHPFQRGDLIVLNGDEGIVNEVGWRGTLIDRFDGRRVIVPNLNVVTSVVTNNSIKPQLRNELNFNVDLQLEFAQVENLILNALRPVQGISDNPSPTVLLDNISGNAMNVLVWIWVLDPVNQQRRVVSNARRAIKECLESNNISLNPATAVVMSKKNPFELAAAEE